jgi:hypothetical protein
LKWRSPEIAVKLGDRRARQLVQLNGPQFGLDDLIQQVPIEFCRSGLALRLDMLSHETIGQFRHGWHSAFGGFLAGRIVTMGDRSQQGLRAASGLLWRDLAYGRDGVPPHLCATSCARPIDDDVRHRAGRPYADTEAGHLAVPEREFVGPRLQRVDNALGNP